VNTEVDNTRMAANRILVPLDGSAESNAALPLARTLAKAMTAPITLLRVLAEHDAGTTRQVTEHLDRIARELAESDISVDSLVRHGRAAQEIVAEIRARPTAMVVMRTHARSGIERVILGSVADRVLADCPVPLVLMRPGERRLTAIHTLLVPVDGSPGGALALGTAVALARVTGASIKLVEVTIPIAMQTLATYEYSGMGYYDPDWDNELVDSAKAYVDGLAGRLREAGLSADGEAFSAPDAAQGILDAAERHGADMMVMSTRALTGPARTLLGSVANAIVRNAHCPVVLVHRSQESDQAAAAEHSQQAQ
jgi:nucleotide-binding universal stress UspA family protein